MNKLKPATPVVAFDAGLLVQDGVHLRIHGLGALHGRAVGQLHADDGVALILVRQEAGRDTLGQEHRDAGDAGEQHQRNGEFAHQAAIDRDVAVRGVWPKPRLNQSPSLLNQPLLLGARFEQESGQSRAERERVERGNEHGDGDRERELLIQSAGKFRSEMRPGMNTAARISAIATTGPCTSFMACTVASRGFIPSSM